MSELGSFWRRNTVTIGVVIIVMAFGSILFLQAVATSKLQEQSRQNAQVLSQLKGLTDQLASSSKQRTQQIATLTTHIDCIVTFFGQKDRSQSAIDDIDTCTIKNIQTGGTTNTGIPGSTAPAATTPQSNAQSSTSPAKEPTAPTAPADTIVEKPGFIDRVLVSPIKRLIDGL